jgi:hypothetical protein
MDNDLLLKLLNAADTQLARYSWLNSYYRGDQQNGFLTREQRDALGQRLSRLSVNIPKLAVTSLAERLHVNGFTGVDVQDDWIRNDLDQVQDVIHREALTLGIGWAIVWAGPDGVRVTAESAAQMTGIRDPGSRELVAVMKKWEDEKYTYATVFTPDKVYKLRSDRSGATTPASFHVYQTLDNPLGVVPCVAFVNTDRFEEHGVSEIDDLADLVDGLNLALADLAIAQSFSARSKLAATGVTLKEVPVLDDDGNPVVDNVGDPVMTVEQPFNSNDRILVAEGDNAKISVLNGSDLSGFEAAVRIWLSAIQAVTSLPASSLGILSDQPKSADALRAASQGLESKAQNRGGIFGRSWEQVARLIVAVRDTVDVADVHPRVVWRDFGVSSFGQLSDGVSKLHAERLISRSAALAMLGWDDDKILADRAAMRAEALDTQGLGIRPTTTPNRSENGAQPQQPAA